MTSSTNINNQNLSDEIIISNTKPNFAVHSETNREYSELSRSLHLSTQLQSTLDFERLFEIFTAEIKKTIDICGIEYKNPDLANTVVKLGNVAKHQCNYRLLVGNQNLGELTIFRSTAFTEAETSTLEYLFSSLLYPLRNAILYNNALKEALHDPLTGIMNRSSFDRTLTREIKLSKRHNMPLVLLFADLDRFKKINDNCGHLYGDYVLRNVAQQIQNCIRSTDILFRYGGEEFAILLSNTDIQGAILSANRIRETVESNSPKIDKKNHKQTVTISIGGTNLRADDSAKSLFARADQALYKAKNSGRNCVKFDTGN